MRPFNELCRSICKYSSTVMKDLCYFLQFENLDILPCSTFTTVKDSMPSWTVSVCTIELQKCISAKKLPVIALVYGWCTAINVEAERHLRQARADS